MDNAEIDRRFEVLRKILCNLKYSVNLMPFKEVFDQAKTSEVVFVDHGEPNGDMTCEIKGYYKDGKFFITGAKLTEPIDDIQVAEITKQEEEEELRRRFMAQPKTDLEAVLRQYQKPTVNVPSVWTDEMNPPTETITTVSGDDNLTIAFTDGNIKAGD